MDKQKVSQKKKDSNKVGFTSDGINYCYYLRFIVLAFGDTACFFIFKTCFATREKRITDANRIFLKKQITPLKYATVLRYRQRPLMLKTMQN